MELNSLEAEQDPQLAQLQAIFKEYDEDGASMGQKVHEKLVQDNLSLASFSELDDTSMKTTIDEWTSNAFDENIYLIRQSIFNIAQRLSNEKWLKHIEPILNDQISKLEMDCKHNEMIFDDMYTKCQAKIHSTFNHLLNKINQRKKVLLNKVEWKLNQIKTQKQNENQSLLTQMTKLKDNIQIIKNHDKVSDNKNNCNALNYPGLNNIALSENDENDGDNFKGLGSKSIQFIHTSRG